MEDNYVKLAKVSVRGAVLGNDLKGVEGLVEDLPTSPRGVFVTLKRHGDLRGCIGTYFPSMDSLPGEIIKNAASAALEDPRFNRVSPDELDDLMISVDILSEPEECSRGDLNPEKYGVIVEKGYQSGLLLPDLDGVDTVEDQLRITKRKAGIPPGDENFSLKRFTVERHHGQSPVGKSI